MLRRDTRLRKEYLYRKANEQQEQATFEKKQKIKAALDSGKPIPHDLRDESAQFRQDLLYDDAQEAPTTHEDDEYARAGESDPKILITTSRDPSSRLLQFAKEMKLVFPNSQRMNRGGYVMKDIVDACKANEVTDLVVFHEHRGQPDGMLVCHFPYGPTAYFTLHNVVLRHDIADKGTVSEAYPHLIFNAFESKLGQRCMNILKHLFPVPKEDSKRVMTFANQDDFISFRHHVYYPTSHKAVEIAEVGPRFEARLYEIRLGTVDMKEADVEWALRPYHRTARKREMLA
ncbi:snoRNA-binding rRNA-processing protein imp4 [Blastocladiella emersonii ATCC 22665]|nr:snoRNA-binding rRNA-processing protein imp4 [Blastocladiella emersonii ATCC 22665]